MSNLAMANAPANLKTAHRAILEKHRKRGIIVGIMSAITYGCYTAFMTQGMASGVWSIWYGANSGLSAFFVAYCLSALGASVNDICSAAFTLIYSGVIGRFRDLGGTLNSKAGRTVIIAALFGGPLASTCYVIGLQLAGSIIVPIAALNVAIGTIYGHFAYKQKLSPMMIIGVAICFASAVFIGSAGMTAISFTGTTAIGMIAALGAAIGWGVEGAVGGYACCMMDYELAICIRQCTSGLVNGLVVVTILSLIGGDGVTGLALLGRALVDFPSLWLFAIGGVFASFSYKLWYKSAAMCGAALGEGTNGLYAFFSPFCCWIICGLIFGQSGYALPWQGWVGAVIMVVGILILAIGQDKATIKEA